MGASIAFQIVMGIGLAASAGLRAFLPLLVAGIAGRLGWVHLSDPFQWLASWPALLTLSVAVVAEVLSDKVPLVDNLLDVVQGIVKPAAGAILATSVLTALEPGTALILGIIAGGGSAELVHLAKAKVRLFSSATTAGLGNPILSLGEDLAALAGSILALVVPVLLVLIVVACLAGLLLAIRRFRLRAAHLRRP